MRSITVTDLEQFRPLNEGEKKIAETLLLTQTDAAKSSYHECCSNLKNYGTALEMWSTDHDGGYPENGEVVHPYYLAFGIACRNSNQTPYSYELKDGVYYVQCSGDHSDYGVESPSYDGEMGLTGYVQPEDAPNPTWKLTDYKITTLPSEFDDSSILRIAETWSNGKSSLNFNSRVSPRVENGNFSFLRPIALTSQNILVMEGSNALNMVVARLQPKPLVSDEVLVESFQTLGPALTGITSCIF